MSTVVVGKSHDHDRPPVVAYLILAHDKPSQLARLIRRLPLDSPIYIHFDLRGSDAEYRELLAEVTATGRAELVQRVFCRWGGFGIVEGTINLIGALLNSNRSFDYATLLSGADYPIKSNAQISDFFRKNMGREFIESFSLMKPNRWSNSEGLYKAPERVLVHHVRFRSRIWKSPIVRKPPVGLEIFGGSQWWSLSRLALSTIYEFIKQHPKLVTYFSKSFIPDESFIQTIISNSTLKDNVSGDDLRLTIWDRPDPPYPAILRLTDRKMLIDSQKLFARKFDQRQDAAILDALDSFDTVQRAS